MLDSHGFDLWADGYDVSVRRADEAGEYPFAGYAKLMNALYGSVMQRAPAKVLDVGIGTAVLSTRLYQAGCELTGLDFSADMLDIARRKIPGAKLIRWDFTQGVPTALTAERYDFIISTYALHHLEGDVQTAFILALLKLLAPRGRMLIGDVCFPTVDALRKCREASGAAWDDEEHYLVFSGLAKKLLGYRAVFHPFSFCAGVIEIEREA